MGTMSLNTLVFCVALAGLAEAAAPAPDRREAYYHFSLGQQARLDPTDKAFDRAIEEFRKALALDPGAGYIRGELARVLRDSGRLAEAVTEAEQAVKLAPDDPELHVTLAQLHHLGASGTTAEASLRKAAEHYETAVRLRPTDARTLLTLADLYGRVDRHDDAARVWRAFLKLEEANAEGWLELGRHLLAAGKTEDAAAAFQQAVKLEPGSARAYTDLGDIYSRADQHEQAVLSYRKGLELDPKNLRLRLSLGEALYKAKRLAESVTEADATLLTDPKNRFALELKGRALRDLKRYDEAMAAADAALGADPRDLKSAYLKVTISEAQRDWAAAEATLLALLARDRRGEPGPDVGSNDRVFLVHLGFAQQQLDRPADAAESFRRALAVGGDAEPALHGYRVGALVAAKDLGKALAEVRAARTKFAGDLSLALLEAEVLRRQGDVAAATRVADEAGAAATSPEDLAAVAEFLQRAQRLEDAEKLLRKARTSAPKDVRVLFQLGAVLERRRAHADAEALFREALALEPESAPVLNYLGYMNADRGVKLEESLAMIERAVKIEPGNSAYLDSLGWVFFRLGRLDEAEKTIRLALEKQGTEPDVVVLDHLGDILQKKGRTAEAIASWQKALGGEDESGDLDRAGVERKIREAQSRLDAQAQAH